MVFESIAIALIMLAIIVIFVRTRGKAAVTLIPLLIQPVANILANIIDTPLSKMLSIDIATVYISTNVVFLVISSLLTGLFTSNFVLKKSKIIYSMTCIIFNLLLVVIFVSNYLA